MKLTSIFSTLLLTLTLTIAANAQILSDDFNDGVPDTSKWITGTGFSNDAINYNPSVVTSSETGGMLTFTHPGSFSFWVANAYTSQSTFDLRETRSSAYLDPASGLSVWLAIGQDPTHFARIAAIAGADGTFFVQCDYWNGNKISHTGCVQAPDYAVGFLAIRVHNNRILFESSPDGLTWTQVGSVIGAGFANPARVEVGGGGFFPFGSTITGRIDDLLVE